MTKIKRATWYGLYETVPAYKYNDLKKYLGIERLQQVFNGKCISETNYKKLQGFCHLLLNNDFSKIGSPVEFDNDQKRMYFQELNNFINSVDFMLIKQKKRNDVIEEQKRIGRQLQINY